MGGASLQLAMIHTLSARLARDEIIDPLLEAL